jgi:hypothetical protein
MLCSAALISLQHLMTQNCSLCITCSDWVKQAGNGHGVAALAPACVSSSLFLLLHRSNAASKVAKVAKGK